MKKIEKILEVFRGSLDNIDSSLQNIKRLKNSLALYYQENSKLTTFDLVKMGEQIRLFSEPYVLERAAQPYKCFPGTQTYNLNEYINNQELKSDLFETISNRKSIRIFSSYKISINEIAKLLYYSYGITHEEKIRGLEGNEGIWSYRAVPSGGGLYPLEIYIFIRNSVLPEGMYHYRADRNLIEFIHKIDGENIKKIILGEPVVDMDNYSCIIIISSVFDRSLMKYGERGYRFILQETGFVSENVSLIVQAMGLSSCMIGSFIDDHLNNLLRADGVLESVQSVIIIGKSKCHEN